MRRISGLEAPLLPATHSVCTRSSAVPVSVTHIIPYYSILESSVTKKPDLVFYPLPLSVIYLYTV